MRRFSFVLFIKVLRWQKDTCTGGCKQYIPTWSYMLHAMSQWGSLKQILRYDQTDGSGNTTTDVDGHGRVKNMSDGGTGKERVTLAFLTTLRVRWFLSWKQTYQNSFKTNSPVVFLGWSNREGPVHRFTWLEGPENEWRRWSSLAGLYVRVSPGELTGAGEWIIIWARCFSSNLSRVWKKVLLLTGGWYVCHGSQVQLHQMFNIVRSPSRRGVATVCNSIDPSACGSTCSFLSTPVRQNKESLEMHMSHMRDHAFRALHGWFWGYLWAFPTWARKHCASTNQDH